MARDERPGTIVKAWYVKATLNRKRYIDGPLPDGLQVLLLDVVRAERRRCVRAVRLATGGRLYGDYAVDAIRALNRAPKGGRK